MSGGALVWLTDDELEILTNKWFAQIPDEGVLLEDSALREKLENYRAEIACKLPGTGRRLARDA